MFLINIHSVLLSEIIQELQWKPVKQIASWEKNPTLPVNSSSVSNGSMQPTRHTWKLRVEDLTSILVCLKRRCGLNLHPDGANWWLQCRYARPHQQIDVSAPWTSKENRYFKQIIFFYRSIFCCFTDSGTHSGLTGKKINTQIQCHFCSWDQCKGAGCCSRISPSAHLQPVLCSSKISHSSSNSAGLAKYSLLHKVNRFLPLERKKGHLWTRAVVITGRGQKVWFHNVQLAFFSGIFYITIATMQHIHTSSYL